MGYDRRNENGCTQVAKATLMSSAATLMLLAALPATAQTSTPEPTAEAAIDEAQGDIVVTGFRASIATALDAKRRDTRVSDGISAEDLGKFPSQNITESIQRISGVQMQNINGRGATISIRGLGPQYALTTINGQTFKSADFTDGFRYDIIQTELANAVQVLKSPTADMDSGGLSGTINIQTVKPLDYSTRKIVVSAKAQNSEYAGKTITPKVGVSYVDQLADGKLGVYVNLGYQKLEDRADYLFQDRWATQTINGARVAVPRRPRYRRIDRSIDQLMGSGGLQWRPMDNLEVDATAIYARDDTHYDVNQQVFLFNTARLAAGSVSDGASKVTTATNFTLENNRQEEKRKLSSQGYTLSTKWTGEDGWAARVAANYTRGHAYVREDAAILGVTIPSATLDITDPRKPKYMVAANLSDPALYTQSTLTRNEFPVGATRKTTGKEVSTQVDVTKDVTLGPISQLAAGTKFRHESFVRDVSRHDLASLTTRPGANSTVFPTLSASRLGVGGFLNDDGNIPNAWVAPDIAGYRKALSAAGINVPDLPAPEGSYTVDRYIPAVYAMASLESTLFGAGLRGNVGVRYEHTRQLVRGNVTQPRTGSYTNVTTKIGDYEQTQEYGNVLPSLNLVVEPTKKLQFRFAAAKVLVRPILDSTTSLAQTTSSVANTFPANTRTITVDLGQAGLKPLTADQIDLGAEWYYGTASALSINGFYKWVKNGTFSSLVCPATFGGVSLSRATSGTTNGDCVDASGNIYNITQTANDARTIRIRGVEVSWNQSLDQFLPVDGFGFIANYTRVIPTKVAIGTGFTVRNLSKNTANITPYWENDRFSLRVSANYRSSYEQNGADSFFATEGHTVRARTQFDLAAGYTPTDTLSFAAGVINLNNSREEAFYNNNPSIWQESSFYGRSFYLSATLRM
ncbi:TonB-dependent receptor [Sphingomonas endophytica]|uniref:TonB-dependent receptor n=2 Tax=Sphingomonas endophytica TaxID=869719 RepID=A0A147HVA7_9SPHN|nr:TonB-dependent receptor [Sphingomonas endophytica]